MSSTRKILPLLALLAGCQYVPILPGLTPFKIDVQQGNYVTQDMVEKVKPGMSKSQVRFALGTPLVVDPFHNDRWDYIYELSKRGRLVEHRRIVVVFDNDKLVRIEGDAAPAAPGSNAAVGAAERSLTGAAATAPSTAPATQAAMPVEAPLTGEPLAPAIQSGSPAAGDKPAP